jgi:hypothetical protein
MKLKRLHNSEGFWFLVSMWIAAVALYAIWHEATEVDRLRLWADSVEWSINADPLTKKNATELRAKLGDEKFLAAAAAAYPDVDLRDTLHRYESERASRPRYEHPILTFAFWALIPPAFLYAGGVLLLWSRRAKRMLAGSSARNAV